MNHEVFLPRANGIAQTATPISVPTIVFYPEPDDEELDRAAEKIAAYLTLDAWQDR